MAMRLIIKLRDSLMIVLIHRYVLPFSEDAIKPWQN